MKKEHESTLESTEMQMVEGMCGTSLRDKKTSVKLRDKLGNGHKDNWWQEHRQEELGEQVLPLRKISSTKFLTTECLSLFLHPYYPVYTQQLSLEIPELVVF